MHTDPDRMAEDVRNIIVKSFRNRIDFKYPTASLLSGGEQQMLTIGRALMTNPSLLLMDEPSEGLAPIIVEEIGRVIGRLKEGGISILLVEQNISMALDLADYVYIISKGVIEYESKPDDLIKNEEIISNYLGVAGNEGNEPNSLSS